MAIQGDFRHDHKRLRETARMDGVQVACKKYNNREL